MHMVNALSMKIGLMMLFRKDSAADNKNKRFITGKQTKSEVLNLGYFMNFNFLHHSLTFFLWLAVHFQVHCG